ncbi:hypothetical protein [Micromonospora okii]|uniref:hypothetical protein n=1 Tax=Micromonospora okii TaxID=1182970 RepID=UPI001E2F7199|nr:hypothetical protein [Micromonospora okii]
MAAADGSAAAAARAAGAEGWGRGWGWGWTGIWPTRWRRSHHSDDVVDLSPPFRRGR